MKVAGLEEAHAVAPAHVAEEEKLAFGGLEVVLVAFAVRLEVLEELVFALVEGHLQDLDLTAPAHVDERLVEMRAEDAGVQVAVLEEGLLLLAEFRLYFLDGGNDLFLRGRAWRREGANRPDRRSIGGHRRRRGPGKCNG